MIPVDITNREEAMEWLLRHGYSVDVAKEELTNWEGDRAPVYDEDGEEYEEEVVELEVLEEEYEEEDDEEEYEEDEEEDYDEDEEDDEDDGLPSSVER